MPGTAESQEGSTVLGEIAKVLIQEHPRGWYEKWSFDEIAKRFIELMFDVFPWLFSDDGFHNSNVSAFHHRRKYI